LETNEANGAREKNSRAPSTVLLPGLRAARLGEGMTQVELAASSGVGRASLSKLENCKRTARPATALRIARGLGVEVEEIVAPPKAGLTLFPISPEGRGIAYLNALRRMLDRLDRRLGEAMDAGGFEMGLAEFAANVERDVWEKVVPEMRLMQGIGGMPQEEQQGPGRLRRRRAEPHRPAGHRGRLRPAPVRLGGARAGEE
jgi:transcriptional regulator with XRE-family HTH domain